MDEIQKINFSLKRFESSKDKDFDRAIMIYNEIIPADTKTRTNEIIYFADNCKVQPNREMFFFGMYVNSYLMGFVECGYLINTKTLIIDYIVLKQEYHLNSVFYPLFSLLQRYFSESMIDYDYIVTEVSTKCPEESVDSESFFSKKMLQIEDYRIIDALYLQPQLGLNNEESNFEFQLMIKSSQSLTSLKKSTYLAIVRDIYFEHYNSWYQKTEVENAENYKIHIESQYELIKLSLENCDEVRLSVHDPVCEYFKAPDCHYTCSTAGFISEKNKSRPSLLVGIPFITVLAALFAFILTLILEKYNITSSVFTPIFAAITVICTSIFINAFNKTAK